MPTQARLRSLVCAFSLAALAACGGSSDPFPDVDSTQLNDHGPIFRSLTVILSEPGGVDLEYWSGNGPRLSVRSASASARSHQVALPRLRANASYSYEVRATQQGLRSAASLSGSFQTADLPADLKSIAFATTGTASQPLTFLSVRSAFTGGVVVDAAGQIVWYGRTSVAPQGAGRRANGNWVLVEDGLAEFSPLGERVGGLAQSRLPAGSTIHHGVTATPRDTVLFLTFDPRTYGAQVLYGEALWEWNPQDDSIVKRWSAFDFLDPAVDFGTRSIPGDWFHANSVTLGPRGNAVLSFHFLDQVLSVAPDFGSIEWRLGGPGSSFALPADAVTSGQHSAREVATNQVLLFDNGFARADGSRYSRALEMTLEPVTGSASVAWQYRPTPDIWAAIISSVRRLGNGNSVLTFGTPAGLVGSTGPISLHEVSTGGQLLWQMVVILPSGSVFQGDPIASIGGETPVP